MGVYTLTAGVIQLWGNIYSYITIELVLYYFLIKEIENGMVIKFRKIN